VSDFLTEEQQLAEIKQWFEKYGKIVLLVVSTITFSFFGYQGWQYYQKTTAQAAAAVYQEMTVTIAAIEQDKSNQDKAEKLANRLKTEYKRTTYAQFAALFIAKFAVEQKKYDQAIEELQWVLDRHPAEPIKLTTQLRLARVWLAKEDAIKALSFIENVQAGAFTASYEELKGDVYIKLGKTNEARVAYQKAVDAAKQADALEHRSILEMKLDDLAIAKDATK
jgi:predicted negative regulator of RcsB-dependent stress response